MTGDELSARIDIEMGFHCAHAKILSKFAVKVCSRTIVFRSQEKSLGIIYLTPALLRRMWLFSRPFFVGLNFGNRTIVGLGGNAIMSSPFSVWIDRAFGVVKRFPSLSI